MEEQEYKIMFEIENDYWWYRGLHELVLGLLKKSFGERRDIAILDAGCGTGRMLELIDKAGYKNAAGLDYSPRAADFSRQRGLQNVVQEDLNGWQPEENKYDCLISLDVLYHSAIADDLAVLKKFFRALRPGGIMLLNLPAFDFLKRGHDAAVWTKKRYRAGGLKKNLQEAGFKAEFISYRLPWLFFIMLLKKMMDKIFRQRKPESDLKKLPGILNNFFLMLHRWENSALLTDISFPFGTSVFAIGRKDKN
jgi:SAM-dependent methyltransferase